MEGVEVATETPVLLQSAVRLPTPEAEPAPEPGLPSATAPESAALPAKRKRPSYSRSRSPSPQRRQILRDVDPNRAAERERQLEERLRQRPLEDESKPLTDAEKQEKAKEEYNRLLNARSGGTYIPPARLRALQAQVTDKTSKEWQRMNWEALKKSINGIINRVNVSNIKPIVGEIFGENLVRGRGLFCRSIMKAQAASLPFTPIYAALVAIVNTKLPQVGELLINRLVTQWKKAYRRNDKTVLKSSTTFIAHLCNQQVVHELLAAHMLQLLLSKPTDDSVEVAVDLTREIGQHLEEMNGPIALLVFDQFRSILHEADIEKRTQYMIEVLFQVRKDRYKDNPSVKEELDLVEEDDQITHQAPSLEDTLDVEDGLNIFKYDAEFEEHEEAYKKLKAEILGEASGSDDDDESGSEDSSDNEEAQKEREMEIKDQSNTDLTNLRRTIYLTINSSADFEECCHKLMKVNLPPGKESELPSMIIETCSQRPTYEKFYGLVGERFAKLNRMWLDLFEDQFQDKYSTIHRYETNRLRNIARFFGHILSTDAIGWHVLSVIHLNEEETTSSGRIFIKILFQDLAEAMGMKLLQERLKEPTLQPSFEGLFPKDNPRNTRFSINYFTSIGMGAVTEDLREYLKNLPKPTVPALPAAKQEDSDSDSASSYSSYSSGSRSYSRSRSRTRSRSRSPQRSKEVRGRSPAAPAGGRRGRSELRSLSRSESPHARQNEKIASTRRRKDRSYSRSRSRSPARRERNSDGRSKARDRSGSRTPPRHEKSHPASDRQDHHRTRSESASSESRSPSPRRDDRGRKNERRRNSSSSSSASESRSRSPPARKDEARPRSGDQNANSNQRNEGGKKRGRERSASDSSSASPSHSPPPSRRQPQQRGGNQRWERRDGERTQRERSLSPYSKRVALTKETRRQPQQRG